MEQKLFSNLRKDRKGISPAAISALLGFVVLAIVLTVGSAIVTEVRDTQAVTSQSYLAANNSLTGIARYASFQSIVGLVLAAGLVLAIVGGVFAFGNQRR